MLALERHRTLLQHLNSNGSLRTAEIAKELGVTEETVRRDFEKLERAGALKRSHGGAMPVDASRLDFTRRVRSQQNAASKSLIAKAALAHIQAGKTLYFDASTTVHELAILMPDQAVTILTNALQTALILSEKPSVKVVVLGGNLSSSSLSCTGWGTDIGLETHRIDAAFLSCRGIDPEKGLSEATEEQCRTKSRIVKLAGEVFLLADKSKTGLASSYFFAHNSDVDLWITDSMPDSHIYSTLRSQGMRVEVAEKNL